MFEQRQPQDVIASYPTYEQAQTAVDALSDKGFDVSKVQIVGRGLHTVEQVTGRMTTGKATLSGAGSGAWFGLFVGLLFLLFAPWTSWAWWLFGAMIIGAVWGAIFGGVAHALRGGNRDFSSVKALSADQYSISVDPRFADQAVATLAG